MINDKKLTSTTMSSDDFAVLERSFLSRMARLRRVITDPKMQWRSSSPVLVQLDSSNNNFTGMNANRHTRAVRLIPLDTIDVNDPLLAVHLCDLAIAPLVLAPDDPYFIILPYWK